MEDDEWETEEQEQTPWPWEPKDLEVDPERQARLKEKMENSIRRLESSEFYTAFIKQLKSPEVSDQLRLTLGNEKQFQIVIYGIGSIEKEKSSRLQLSIAMLMKKEFDWIDDNIEVFDPVLSATESNLLESLGCTVLYVNEQCRREALKPTIFFMPHCPITLYANLLQANWKVDRLSRIMLFGNSFIDYKELLKKWLVDIEHERATKGIRAAGRFTSEFAIKTVSYGLDFRDAFNGLSLHFFSSVIDSELPLL